MARNARPPRNILVWKIMTSQKFKLCVLVCRAALQSLLIAHCSKLRYQISLLPFSNWELTGGLLISSFRAMISLKLCRCCYLEFSNDKTELPRVIVVSFAMTWGSSGNLTRRREMSFWIWMVWKETSFTIEKWAHLDHDGYRMTKILSPNFGISRLTRVTWP